MKKILFVMAMLVIVALTLVLTSCSGGKKKNGPPGTEDTVRFWGSVFEADSVFPMYEYDDYKLVKLAMLPGAVTYVGDMYDSSRSSDLGIDSLELPEGATDIYFGSTDTNVVQIEELNGPADLDYIENNDWYVTDYSVKITAVNVGKAKIYAAYKLDGKQYHVALPVEVLDFYVEFDETTFETWGSNYSKNVNDSILTKHIVELKYNNSKYVSLYTNQNETIAKKVIFITSGDHTKTPLKVTKLDGTSPTNVTWSKIILEGDEEDFSVTPNGNKAVVTKNSSGNSRGFLVVKVGEYSLPIYIEAI